MHSASALLLGIGSLEEKATIQLIWGGRWIVHHVAESRHVISIWLCHACDSLGPTSLRLVGQRPATRLIARVDNPSGRMSALLKTGFLLKHTPTSAVFLSLGQYVWGALVWPVVQCGTGVYALGTSTDSSSAIWQHVVHLGDWTEVPH